MSCASIRGSNVDRNIDTIEYPERKFKAIAIPEIPFKYSAFPYIDTREVSIRPPVLSQNITVTVPAYDMRYTFGCTNCVRNRNIIIAP